MAKAIEEGLPKMRIEEAAARTQARLDSGAQKLVGVNTYRLADEDRARRPPGRQRQRLQAAARQARAAARGARRTTRSTRTLHALTRSAEDGHVHGSLDGNLLALAVDAARAKATVGEISEALEKVYGRHQAVIRTISGVYKRESGSNEAMAKVLAATEQFAEDEGRRPRILVAKMGQDGHDRGQKVIVTAFADMGFDVDVGPLFSTPEEVAQQAVDADVHIVGVNSLAAGHLTLVPGAQGGAGRARRRGRDDRGRRRDPARRRPHAARDGCRRGLPARHRDRRGGARPARRSCPPSSATPPAAELGRDRRDRRLTSPALVEGVRAGRRASVSRAITLVESARADHRVAGARAAHRADRAVGRGARSVRVGISGVPGVGKSTFIESARRAPDRARGTAVGVLAVDPSSVRTGGSVLGDKTRMARLAANPRRLHPALADGRHPRRRRPGDHPGDDRAGGRRVRRGAGRDRRRRPVRGDRRGHGRHLPVPHPRPHRRPAPGHQEGHPRDRRRDRGEQGRRRPRDRRRRRSAAKELAGALPAGALLGRGLGAAGADLLGAARRRRRRGLGAGAGPPGVAGGAGPGRQAGRAAAGVHLGAGARRARPAAAALPGVRAIRDDVRRALLAGEITAPLAADRLVAAYDGPVGCCDVREPGTPTRGRSDGPG